ncbi:putative iron(III)-transport system permease [Rhodobacterales bacterium HTCC2654]|uniref:Putative iron(III)-transport system permease n=2 Tax=Roseobacteraceae TaxID=2854170 RepID=A3VLK9_9RHOB|nr:putative iron(III)-transport system permease [Rhodobacterales bacterium HTCC2654] [Maritimibacter alkaliphilus HTCC2654]
MAEISMTQSSERNRERRPRRRSELGLAAWIIIIAGTALAIYLIAVPLLMLLFTAFRGPSDFLPFEPGAGWTLGNLIDVYTSSVLYTRIIPDTLIFAGGSVTLSFTVGFTLAWLIERTDLPARDTWFTLILFPMLVPSIVLAIAWIFLMGPQAGWLNVALEQVFGVKGVVNVFSMGGLILCQSLATIPFTYLLLSSALRTMNPSLEEASGASGASSLTTFRKVTVPVLLPGLLAPLILVTLVTLEQYELPSVIGVPAQINVFSYRILYELNPADGLPNYGGAAAVALPFLLMGILLLALYNLAVRRADKFVTVTGKAYRQRRLELGRWKVPSMLFLSAYVLLAGILPALVLVWTAFFGFAPPSLASLSSFSAEPFQRLFASREFWLAIRNTFFVAAASAAIITMLGGLVAWVVMRLKFPGRTLLDFFSFMSIGIPSVIAGLAIMLLYLTLPVGIYGTVWILVIAYSYRLAISTRLAKAGLLQMHKELEEASSASGATWISTQWRVVLPLMRPALFSSFVLLFIVGVREFTLPLILHSPDNVVLSVLLWRLYQNGDTIGAAALGSLIVLLVIPIVILARRALSRSS